ncbi:MAG TPA: alkaline phosphatase family protein [Candidatus Acidoferrales bacterium]|nr:alkaline phosphatase family protein [Candidatus Acidoferrales bacterium]
MFKKAAALGLAVSMMAAPIFANEGDVPKGVPHLDHVFVIMMENHGYQQVFNNPNEPYLNSLIANKKVNLATNYFAIGHPSLTNYLEVVGGSNFGVRSDNAPNWHSTTCTPNIISGNVNADDGGGTTVPAPVPFETTTVCPISGTGTDAVTPAVDNWNEVTLPTFPYLADIDGIKSVPAAPTEGKTIGDQLVAAGMRWKSYQESLPLTGADLVNYSNGTSSNLTDFTSLAPLTSASVVQDYAVKHNPFAYFQSVQEGMPKDNGLQNVVGFEGPHGLFADLATGNVPALAFIAPNQCNDQHGRGNADAYCAFDPGIGTAGLTNGTQVGLNGGLILQGDVTIEQLVKAIKHSPAWHDGRSAIVIVWDENDYSGISTTPSGLFPPQNQNTVVLTVETNSDEPEGVQSSNYYNSFSLLKSMEAGFGLPCLNHACDKDTKVMSDLFGHDGDHDGKW